MNVRALEDSVLRHIEVSDVWRRIVSAWLDAPLTEQEREAFIMWLVGHPTIDIARVLVAYDGQPEERDGVSRQRAQHLLRSARRKVSAASGIDLTELYAYARRKPRPSMRVQNGMALCTRCNRMLPVSAYYPDKRDAAGIRTYCKECTRELDRARYRKESA